MPLNSFYGMRNIFSPPDTMDNSGDDLSTFRRAMSGAFSRRVMNGAFSNYNLQDPETDDRGSYYPRQFQPGPSLKKYLDYANQSPNREDYEPSKWRTALATAAGALTGYRNPIAGMKAAEDVRDDPYNEAQQDYQLKLKGYKDAAAAENQAENWSAMSGYRNYNAVTGRDKLTETATHDRNTERVAGEKNDIQKGWNLARVAQFGVTNQQGQEKIDESKRHHGVSETNTSARISETGRHDKVMEGIGQQNANTNAGRAGTYSRDVDSKIDTRKNTPKTGKQTSKGPSPGDITSATKQAYKDIAARNPEKYGNFVSKTGDAVPPTGWLGGKVNNSDYQNYLSEVEKRKREILAEKYGNPQATPGNDNVQSVDY